MTAPKMPAIKPKIPPAIPIQMGKVKISSMTISMVVVELEELLRVCIDGTFQLVPSNTMQIHRILQNSSNSMLLCCRLLKNEQLFLQIVHMKKGRISPAPISLG